MRYLLQLNNSSLFVSQIWKKFLDIFKFISSLYKLHNMYCIQESKLDYKK